MELPFFEIRSAAVAMDLAPIEAAIDRLAGEPYIRAASASPDTFGLLDTTEQAIAEGGSGGRRQAFTSGRLAAKRALYAIGSPVLTVLSDQDGVPIFPCEYQGSIAHKHGRAVAVAAPAGSTSVGIDLEFDEDLDEMALESEVVTPSEVSQVRSLLEMTPALRSPASVFVAVKEAVYKAVFPRTRHEFTFDELEIEVDPSLGRFAAVRFPSSAGLVVRGQYQLHDRWVVAVARCSLRV